MECSSWLNLNVSE